MKILTKILFLITYLFNTIIISYGSTVDCYSDGCLIRILIFVGIVSAVLFSILLFIFELSSIKLSEVRFPITFFYLGLHSIVFFIIGTFKCPPSDYIGWNCVYGSMWKIGLAILVFSIIPLVIKLLIVKKRRTAIDN